MRIDVRHSNHGRKHDDDETGSSYPHPAAPDHEVTCMVTRSIDENGNATSSQEPEGSCDVLPANDDRAELPITP